MRTVPEPKVNELVERLNRLDESEVLDELELARIENEARKLISADAAGGNMILGMVAAMRYDEESAIRSFERARKLHQDDSLVRNYARTKFTFHRYDEVLELFSAYVGQGPYPRNFSKVLVDSALLMGRYHKVLELIDAFKKWYPEEPLEEELREVESFCEAAIDLGSDDDLNAPIMTCLWNLLREEKVWDCGFSYSVTKDIVQNHVVLKGKPVEESERINEVFIRRLAESDLMLPTENVVIVLPDAEA